MEEKGWRSILLGEFVTLQRGFDITKKEQEVGPYKVYSSSGPNSTHSKYQVKGPGVIIGRKGTLGTAFYSDEDFWPHDTTLWVKDFHGNDPKFAYHFLKSMRLEQYDCGASNPTLNRNHIHLIPVSVPLVPIQQKIAVMLSAYDDLIENNLRRIKILEEMARSLYREWFVKFRFPGHQKVKMVNSPLGKIPEGWKVSTLGNESKNFDRMRKPLSKMEREKRPGPYPYYGAAKVFDHIDDFIFNGIYLLIAEDGSVVTPDRKPVLQYVNGKFWANNHTHVLQGKEPIPTEFLHLVLSQLDISGYITGAAQPKITQENLNRIPVLVPSSDLLTNFNEIVELIYRSIVLTEEKNKVLRQTRDLLLPKLISSELDVSELDIKTANERS
jgi:type I restriction enzyme S subunit